MEDMLNGFLKNNHQLKVKVNNHPTLLQTKPVHQASPYPCSLTLFGARKPSIGGGPLKPNPVFFPSLQCGISSKGDMSSGFDKNQTQRTAVRAPPMEHLGLSRAVCSWVFPLIPPDTNDTSLILIPHWAFFSSCSNGFMFSDIYFVKEAHALFNPVLVSNFVNGREIMAERVRQNPEVFNSQNWKELPMNPCTISPSTYLAWTGARNFGASW